MSFDLKKKVQRDIFYDSTYVIPVLPFRVPIIFIFCNIGSSLQFLNLWL